MVTASGLRKLHWREAGELTQASCLKAQLLSSFLNCHSPAYSSHTMKNTQTTVTSPRNPLPCPHSLALRLQLDLPFSPGPSWAPESLLSPSPSATYFVLLTPLEAAQEAAKPCFNPGSIVIHQATLGPGPSGPETRRDWEIGVHEAALYGWETGIKPKAS